MSELKLNFLALLGSWSSGVGSGWSAKKVPESLNVGPEKATEGVPNEVLSQGG